LMFGYEQKEGLEIGSEKCMQNLYGNYHE